MLSISFLLVKMVFARSGMPIWTPHPLTEFFSLSKYCFRNSSSVGLIDDGLSTSSASPLYAALLQTINGVMHVALWPQAVSQTPDYVTSFRTQTSCDGCFASQFLCWSFHFISAIQDSKSTIITKDVCQTLIQFP